MVLNLLPDDAPVPQGAYVRNMRMSRQAALAQSISLVGLSRADFGSMKRTISPFDSRVILPALVHQPTGAYFIFSGRVTGPTEILNTGASDEFASIAEPGIDLDREKATHKSWEDQLAYFRKWLAVLVAEMDSANIWKMDRADPAADLVFALDAWAPDEPFQPHERDRVATAWREIEKRATEEALASSAPPDLLDEIRARFDRIDAKIDKQSKRDWVGGAMYALFGIVMQCGLEGFGAMPFLKWAARLIATALGLPVPGIDSADYPRIGG